MAHVTFFPLFYDTVSTNGMLTLYKAFVLLDIQNVTHVPQAAGGELVVVLLDPVGGLREHQEPAFVTGDLQASTVRTLIMRGSKTMAQLMGEGQVHLCGRKIVAVVLKGDETRVVAEIVTILQNHLRADPSPVIWSSFPGQTKNPSEVSVGQEIRQAVVVPVRLGKQTQKLLRPNVCLAQGTAGIFFGDHGEKFNFEVHQLYAVKLGFVVNVVYCFHVGGNLSHNSFNTSKAFVVAVVCMEVQKTAVFGLVDLPL